MTTFTMKQLANTFRATMEFGIPIRPRDMLIKELVNHTIEVDANYPFQEWPERGYDINYFKKEMLWKLGAGPYDKTILQHASMWKSVQNPDGTFNSNYGQYWFGAQQGLMKAYQELIRDKDSRRAAIPMLQDKHLDPGVKDTVCTESITFLIRGMRLYCIVHMRSSDQIFGLGTDIPTFSVLAKLMAGLLEPVYGYLEVHLSITAASSHIYERHFNKVNAILEAEDRIIDATLLPDCSGHQEAMYIISRRGIADVGPRRFRPPADWHLYRFLYE